MGAPIRRLWHHITHWPFLNHAPVPGEQGTVVLDEIPVTFKECEGVCEPTAEQIQAKERERADRFKSDQLLPIMGIGGGSPSPPS